MQCVILAGGLATRMRPITEKIPKSLLPIRSPEGGEKPFVDYQIEYLRKQGVSDLVFCIGYKGEMLKEHLEESSLHGVSICFSDEGENLRGTGGALRLAYEQGLLKERFFVTYGDSFLPIDFRAVWQDFISHDDPALMTVLENFNQWDQSNAIYQSNQVVLYDKKATPKPPQMKFIDYGLSAMKRDVVRDFIVSGQVCDLASVFRELSLLGKLRGFLVKQRFYEVGSFEGLAQFEQYLTLGN